jgi:hypothetical protein
MSKTQLAGVLIGLGVAFCHPTGYAQARVKFGTDERIRDLQPTEDPQYTLGYKVRTYFFFAGCYVKDDGYVLHRTGALDEYIPLDAAKIEQLQKEGILPSPLPTYSLSFWDYFFGYSNWIILAFVIGVSLIQWARTKAKKRPVPASTEQAGLSPGSSEQAGPAAEEKQLCYLCGKQLTADEAGSRVYQSCRT